MKGTTKAPAFMVRVNRGEVTETWDQNSRTPEQFEAVRSIVQGEDFDYACGSMVFHVDVTPYTGPFAFCYYTRDGSMHMQRIGKRGKVLRHIRCPVGGLAEDVV